MRFIAREAAAAPARCEVQMKYKESDDGRANAEEKEDTAGFQATGHTKVAKKTICLI